VILASVERATRAALADPGAFERDGVVFDAGEVHWPILGPLFEARSACPGILTVLDIGGSLASKWLQHRAFLPSLAPLKWVVIEQEHYVTVGRQLFDPREVSFHSDMAAGLASAEGADVILFSSSLHYFEDPMSVLDQAAREARRSLIIDRSPVWPRTAPQLAVQGVGLYARKVQYPCWVLSRDAILNRLRESFDVVTTWDEPMPIPTHPSSAPVAFLGVTGIGKSP
jgi:putative methyltransferase (TIGR04325 family)